MKKRKIIPILATALIMSGCTTVSTDSTSKPIPAQESATSLAQGIDLNDDELSEFTKLFNTNEYKVFLHEAFDNPEQIFWDYLTRYMCIAKEEKYSDELKAEYLKAHDEQFGYKEDELRWPLYSLKKSDISDFIKRHSGLHKTPDLN